MQNGRCTSPSWENTNGNGDHGSAAAGSLILCSPVALRLLLDGEGPAVWADGVPTPAFLDLLQHGGTDDEDGVGMATSLQASNPASLSPSLLEGVTAEGDTNGDGASRQIPAQRHLRQCKGQQPALQGQQPRRHSPPLRRQGPEIFHGLPPRRPSSRR